MAPRAWGTAVSDPNAPRLPNLEPDQFWFVVRATGHEQQLRDWVALLNKPTVTVPVEQPVEGGEQGETETVMVEQPNPRFNPIEWAAVSSKVDFGKHFERDHPFVEAAVVELGFNPAEFDALWMYGAGS